MPKSRQQFISVILTGAVLVAFVVIAIVTTGTQPDMIKPSLQNSNSTSLPSFIQNHVSQIDPDATGVDWPTPHDFADPQEAIKYVSELLGPQYAIVESHARLTKRRRFEEMRVPTGFGISGDFLASEGMDDPVWVIGLRTVPPVHPQRLSDLTGIPVSEPWTPEVANSAMTPGANFVPGHLGGSGVAWSPGQSVVMVLDDAGNVTVAEYTELPNAQGTPVPLNSWHLTDIDNLPSE